MLMKRIIQILLLSTGIAVAASASAATTIGTIDMQKIFTTSPEVKKINSNLEKKFSSRKNSLLKEQKTLQADMKKLEKNQSVLKSSDLSKLSKKVNTEKTSFAEKQAKFQQDLYTAQNEAMRDFMEKLKKSVGNIANKKGIDAVFPSNNLLFSKKKLDITEPVLKKLD